MQLEESNGGEKGSCKAPTVVVGALPYAGILAVVPPRRLERLPPAPEAGALSTELRGHVASVPQRRDSRKPDYSSSSTLVLASSPTVSAQPYMVEV